jgi:hypothetical protein
VLRFWAWKMATEVAEDAAALSLAFGGRQVVG